MVACNVIPDVTFKKLFKNKPQWVRKVFMTIHSLIAFCLLMWAKSLWLL